MTNLQEKYRKEIAPQLMQQFGYKSVMEVPKIDKITLNMGVGEAVNDRKIIEAAVADLTKIAGQKAIIRRSRKSVASFKIREGWPVGCKVTLRRKRKEQFFERLLIAVLPRIRDFRGISARSFDGRGNLNFGITEQIVFPEINYDQIDTLRGLNVTITTTAKNDAEAKALLAAYGFPFKD